MRLCPISVSVIVHYDNKKSLQDIHPRNSFSNNSNDGASFIFIKEKLGHATEIISVKSSKYLETTLNY